MMADVIPSKKILDTIVDLIPKMSQKLFFEYTMPALKQSGGFKTDDDWGHYLMSLNQIPEGQRMDFSNDIVCPLARGGRLKVQGDWAKTVSVYKIRKGLE